VGQPATVVADAFADQRLAARVALIAPAVDAQRGAVEVTLTLDQDAPAFLREDMTLSIEVETARRSKALALALAALRSAPGVGQGSAPGSAQGAVDDTGEVLVVVDGRAQPRSVRLGLRSLQAVEVLDGLQPGDVVVWGAGAVPGQRVRVRGQE
jgi:HlyD family secretion protein